MKNQWVRFLCWLTFGVFGASSLLVTTAFAEGNQERGQRGERLFFLQMQSAIQRELRGLPRELRAELHRATRRAHQDSVEIREAHLQVRNLHRQQRQWLGEQLEAQGLLEEWRQLQRERRGGHPRHRLPHGGGRPPRHGGSAPAHGGRGGELSPMLFPELGQSPVLAEGQQDRAEGQQCQLSGQEEELRVPFLRHCAGSQELRAALLELTQAEEFVDLSEQLRQAMLDYRQLLRAWLAEEEPELVERLREWRGRENL